MKISFLASILFVFVPIFVFGQNYADTLPSPYSLTNFEITLSPTNPSPNQTVSARAAVYGATLQKNTVVWTLNGQVIGQGTDSTSFTVGNLGSRYTLGVQGTLANGVTLSETTVIIPSSVDIFYEAQTTVPPFYKGKALLTNQSDIVFYAQPHVVNSNGTKLTNSQLEFLWKTGGSVAQGQSGIGKNSFLLETGFLPTSSQITVEVRPTSGIGPTARGTASAPFANPALLVYENSSLYGTLYNNALASSFTLPENEITLQASPYFFSKKTPVLISWKLNEAQVSGNENGNTITFRNENNSSGKASIYTQASNLGNILQDARSARINLIFGQQ